MTTLVLPAGLSIDGADALQRQIDPHPPVQQIEQDLHAPPLVVGGPNLTDPVGEGAGSSAGTSQ